YRVSMVALQYELFKQTNDYMSLGWLGLVMTLPTFLLTLPAGQLADSMNRKTIIALGLLLACAASVGLYLISWYHLPLGISYICVVLRSTAGTFVQPARQALLPQVVPPDRFANAVTWNSSFIQIALLLGPALGGFLAGVNVRWAYLADAACMINALLAILLIR